MNPPNTPRAARTQAALGTNAPGFKRGLPVLARGGHGKPLSFRHYVPVAVGLRAPKCWEGLSNGMGCVL